MNYYAAFFFLAFISCAHSLEEVNALTHTSMELIDVGKDVHITYSDSGRVKVIIESPRLEKTNNVNDERQIFPEGIKITFLDNKGEPRSWLIADEAEKSEKSKTFVARGNVNFYNTDNDKLQSHELIWSEKDETVFTDKFVKITRPSVGDTLYGIGFETREEFKKVKIKRRFQGKMMASLPY